MAYDEDLAGRVRAVLPRDTAVTERQMFGGLAFMLGGHMACGVVRDTLMVRLGPENADRALDQHHVRPMDFTGRPMKGMVFVEPAGLHGEALRHWVDAAARYVSSLPPKQSAPTRNRRLRSAAPSRVWLIARALTTTAPGFLASKSRPGSAMRLPVPWVPSSLPRGR